MTPATTRGLRGGDTRPVTGPHDECDMHVAGPPADAPPREQQDDIVERTHRLLDALLAAGRTDLTADIAYDWGPAGHRVVRFRVRVRGQVLTAQEHGS